MAAERPRAPDGRPERPVHTGPGGESIRVFAPATVGNLACGFDVLGLALEEPGDEVVARVGDEPGVFLSAVTGDGGRLPTDPRRNSAAVAARAVLEAAGGTHASVELQLLKGLPLAAGMGGSAASAVAGAVAADALLGTALPRETLLACALEGERTAAGEAHPDNAAPCLYGGIVLTLASAPLTVVQLPVPDGAAVALLHPHIEVETAAARRDLGESVPLRAAVAQWGNTAGLVAGLYRADWALLGRTLVDLVAEPVRARRVPGFQRVKEAALESGAVGASLSGSGPSIFALCRSVEDARRVGVAMETAYRRGTSGEADLHVTAVGWAGARVVEVPDDV